MRGRRAPRVPNRPYPSTLVPRVAANNGQEVTSGASIGSQRRRGGVDPSSADLRPRPEGTQWGRTQYEYPSVVTVSKPDISPRYLSEDERVRIADLATHGAGLREIARDIGRNPSTVSCELRRSADPDDGRCRPFAAQRMATLRRARPGRGRIANDEVLRRCGYDGLNWPHLGVL